MNNSTESNNSNRSVGNGVNQLGMIIAFSILAFLVLDVIAVSFWTCHHFRSRGDSEAQASQRFIFKASSQQSRLKKLEKVAPKEPLEAWWKALKADLHLSNEVDSQFVCAICLEPVSKAQTIHGLKCHHVFHDKCLEGWFLECHFTCPMCHAVFYKELGGVGHSNDSMV